jgi:hypothetical protein
MKTKTIIHSFQHAKDRVILDIEDDSVWHSRSWEKHKRGAIDKRTGQFLHRVLLGLTDRNIHVVFANGNPFDCRRCNMTAVKFAGAHAGPRKPFMRNFLRKGIPCGVTIVADEGRGHLYRYYRAQICTRGKRYWKRFSIAKLGPAEAKRNAMLWRFEKATELGLKPLPVTFDPFGNHRENAVSVSVSDLYGGNADYSDCEIELCDTLALAHVPMRDPHDD